MLRMKMSINGLMDAHKFQLHLISFHSSRTGRNSDNTQPQKLCKQILEIPGPPFLVTNQSLVYFDDVMADSILTLKTELVTLNLRLV